MLTQKQYDLLVYIHERMQENDVAPSFDEMKQALGLKSKSGIHRLISALVERGYLERLPHRARALHVKKLPPGYEASRRNVTNITDVKSEGAAHTNFDRVTPVPLLGRIAAGTPIEAIRHDGEYLEFPQAMMGGGDYYALQVEGESMIRAGIFDRDTVLIRKCANVENGRIAVALVDGEEVTLKKIEKRGSDIALIPENEDYETRVLEAERVTIQGELVTLIRQYH